MFSLATFTPECPELQTSHLLYLIREDQRRRINNGLMVMIFKMIYSAVANACNNAKVSYISYRKPRFFLLHLLTISRVLIVLHVGRYGLSAWLL